MAFTDDKTIVLGGGGGSSRTGVKNRLVSQVPEQGGRIAAALIPPMAFLLLHLAADCRQSLFQDLFR
jgi:hypothetical protein